MSLPKYSEYRDSGLPWLGSLPSHWAQKPMWTLFRRSKRVGHDDEQLLSVYRDFGVVPKASRTDNNNKASDDLSVYQLVKPGDLAINKMKAWQGSVAISEHTGIVSPAYFVYEATHAEDSRYLHYLLRSPRYVAGYLSISKGIRVNQWDLEPQYHSRMPVALPPKREQHAIAAFLDRETGKIDKLIAAQERLIILLAEKRQATISHAVTRGLNPDAPMKDSGVAWLGEVPAHWGVKRMKHLVRESIAGPYGSSLTKSMYVTSGYRVYGQQQVIPDDFSVGDYYVSEDKFAEMPRYQVMPNDVLISVMGTIGRAAVVPFDVEPGIINPRLVLYRVVESLISPRYLQAFLNNSTSQRYFTLAAQGTTMEGLNMVSIGELYVAVPPSQEQVEILKFIRHEGDKLDALSAGAERAISLLRERRSALISAAVTGQIDIRRAVASPQTDEAALAI